MNWLQKKNDLAERVTFPSYSKIKFHLNKHSGQRKLHHMGTSHFDQEKVKPDVNQHCRAWNFSDVSACKPKMGRHFWDTLESFAKCRYTLQMLKTATIQQKQKDLAHHLRLPSANWNYKMPRFPLRIKYWMRWMKFALSKSVFHLILKLLVELNSSMK